MQQKFIIAALRVYLLSAFTPRSPVAYARPTRHTMSTIKPVVARCNKKNVVVAFAGSGGGKEVGRAVGGLEKEK